MPRFKVYATGDREVVEALKLFAPAVQKAVLKRFRRVARSAADDARARASWSKKIPPGITSGATQKGPYIRYLGKAPEIGRLNEERAAWRHPLFGNRERWYTQLGRQFLHPAANAKWNEVIDEAMAAIEDAKEEVGL